MFPYLELAAGLTLLVIGGDALVRGAVGLAERFAIPPIIIGLTIVAFGTSAPELIVSITAALGGAPGIALGNVVGSNVANIFLVLGVPALIAAIPTAQPFVRRNTLFMIGVTLIFIALCFTGQLVFWHGLVLVTLLLLFLAESARTALRQREPIDPGEEGVSNPWLAILLVAAGLIGLPLGARFTVEGASTIAASWGVSDAAIGLTVVAIGTSLPELAATILAAIRRQGGIVVGNVIGSNLFNMMAIMGITVLIAPIPVDEKFLEIDLWIMLAAALVLVPFVWWRQKIGRIAGVVFSVIYVAFIWFALTEGEAEAAALSAAPADAIVGISQFELT
ncbi:MAG: calcium/sodium antiporter [Pseudomonadota bacterium]